MELNKILQGISPVGMNEGDKVIIEIIKGVATIRFEPAKNENFLDDMVEDEDEDLEEEVEEEDCDGEEYLLCEEYEDCDEDCNQRKEHERDIKIATMLQKTLEDLKNILKSLFYKSYINLTFFLLYNFPV